ncbi:MAG: FmdB family zinc ribbon protein [Phycisphaerales bacterium]
MPTYDYKCKACGHRWELFQSMSAKHVKECPSCGKKTAERLIGTGAAVLFKGGGFYQTDYRSDSYKKSAEADSKASKPAESNGAPTATSDTGAAKPAESKPAASAPEPTKKSEPAKKSEPKSKSSKSR